MTQPNGANLAGPNPASAAPPSFRSEFADHAMNYCRLGASHADLAEFFKVDVATIDRWKVEHPAFCEAVKKGQTLADDEVVNRLFRQACGYSQVVTKHANYKGQFTDSLEYVKHHRPDTRACIYWLNNRRPDQWRNKISTELSGPEGGSSGTVDAALLKLEAEQLFLRFYESCSSSHQQHDNPA